MELSACASLFLDRVESQEPCLTTFRALRGVFPQRSEYAMAPRCHQANVIPPGSDGNFSNDFGLMTRRVVLLRAKLTATGYRSRNQTDSHEKWKGRIAPQYFSRVRRAGGRFGNSKRPSRFLRRGHRHLRRPDPILDAFNIAASKTLHFTAKLEVACDIGIA